MEKWTWICFQGFFNVIWKPICFLVLILWLQSLTVFHFHWSASPVLQPVKCDALLLCSLPSSLLHSVFYFLLVCVRVTLRWADSPGDTRSTPWEKDATLQHTDHTYRPNLRTRMPKTKWTRTKILDTLRKIESCNINFSRGMEQRNNETRQQPPQIALPRLQVGVLLISSTFPRESVQTHEKQQAPTSVRRRSFVLARESIFSRGCRNFLQGCRDFPWGSVYTCFGQILRRPLGVYLMFVQMFLWRIWACQDL